jgi:hypothetical protein
MQQLKIDDRNKARRYLEEVDDDRRRWVHNLYGVSWEDAAQYDVVINLAQLNVVNAASILVTTAQLPDFQMTPASRRVMDNLYLGAKARLFLARDERTGRTSFKVRADNGVLTITYNPRDVQTAKYISEVLKGIEGIKEIRPTIATTNLLWIQEKFSSSSETFGQVLDIATKWNAAVELIHLVPGNGEETTEKIALETERPSAMTKEEKPAPEYNGGIEDESMEPADNENGGMKDTLNELARFGRSGGGRVIRGGQELLINSIDRTVPYTLVVIGDIFLSKGQAARVRLSREFRSFVADHIRAPVVMSNELKSHYLFSKKDAISSLVFLGITVLLYYLVFTHQESLLEYLSKEGWQARAFASALIFLFTPLVAYLYGNVAKAFLKLIRME